MAHGYVYVRRIRTAKVRQIATQFGRAQRAPKGWKKALAFLNLSARTMPPILCYDKNKPCILWFFYGTQFCLRPADTNRQGSTNCNVIWTRAARPEGVKSGLSLFESIRPLLPFLDKPCNCVVFYRSWLSPLIDWVKLMERIIVLFWIRSFIVCFGFEFLVFDRRWVEAILIFLTWSFN